MRSSGASERIHSLSGLSRYAKWPVSGFFSLRCRFQRITPTSEFAVQDAGTDDPVATDGGVVPALAGRTQDAVAVQVSGDALCGPAGDTIRGKIQRTISACSAIIWRSPRISSPRAVELVDDAVAIGITAANRCPPRCAPDAAMVLMARSLRNSAFMVALEADMKLVDLAFRQGEDHRARKAQALEDARHVLSDRG